MEMRRNFMDEVLSKDKIRNFHDKLVESIGDSNEVVQEIGETIESVNFAIDQLSNLMEFSSILNSTLDTDEVRQLAMEATCKALYCEAATLYLYDEETDELYFETVVGDNASELKEIRLKVDDSSIAGSVTMNRQSIIVNNVAQDPRHFKQADKKTNFQTNNMACVPIFANGNFLGVLQALNSLNDSFNEKDLLILSALANQVGIAVQNAILYSNLQESFIETIEALMGALEAKDKYTGGHTKRVAYFSELIAKYMNLSKEEIREIKLGALVHDIGKIGIDDKVLKKQAALEGDEWEHMKQHPELGWKILGQVKTMKHIVDGMRYHHERPDGKGYPHGLSREEIPLIASIISVADTFDAMTSTRPYRKGLAYQVAFDEIVKHRGTQFEEKVVDAFVEAFKIEGMGKKSLAQKK